MTALVSYSTGTVSVAAGGTIVTGVGTIWSGTNARPGDLLQIGNFQSVISDVTDLQHIVIPPWGGGAQAGVAYKIWQVSPQRFAGAQAMQTVNELVAALNTSGFFVFVDVDLTEPDPSLGDDGQYAFQPTTGKTWVKSTGVWSYLGIYKAFQLKGAWSGATAYSVGDVVTLGGSSYACILDHTNHTPPNATYWQLLASVGPTGNTGPAAWTPPAAWVTATAYTAGPPASVVVQGGETYVCLVAHTSGTFATDLAAAKWIKVAQAGGVSSLNGQSGAVVLAFETKARVTLTSGVAVTESDVSGVSSVYVTPAGHNAALIYDGSNDVPRSYSEITITLDATNALSGKNFDVFQAYSGGSVVAGYGPAWSSDISRGTGAGTTEIEFFNGRPVNKSAITLRSSSGTTYSIAARQANLVGGFRTTANGLTEDSFTKRFVWSVNSALRGGRAVESTDTWTYSTAAFRQTNGSTSNQIEYLQGLGGGTVRASAYSVLTNSTSTDRGCQNGIGIDSTTVNSATLAGFGHINQSARAISSEYVGSPGIGYHKLVWLEKGAGSDTQTWFGDSGAVVQTGITAQFVM
ncbi:hypothetical protein ABIF63_006011 [Bradyrhizobium japonicum]|uniref:Chitin-binding type-3 domain-containing protein n=1 Tax=Bradyrhizobium japonicum TaxID=375 RepID=A0ABV2RZA8_BRAJP